jgi:hypothetical protein
VKLFASASSRIRPWPPLLHQGRSGLHLRKVGGQDADLPPLATALIPPPFPPLASYFHGSDRDCSGGRQSNYATTAPPEAERDRSTGPPIKGRMLGCP